MAEYLPIRTPGHVPTFKASAAITAGQLVAITGSGTVGPAGATSAAWIGVAGTDAATNDSIAVYRGGTQALVASGAVAAGDAVASAAGGKVATAATPTSAQFVGIAETAAADGAKVRVAFAR